jgi:hypothetical protein
VRAIIVGSGPSARGFEPPAGVAVFAVKRTIMWLSRADYWFALDHNPAAMDCMRNQRPGVKYYCACPDSVELPAGVTRLRRIEGRGPQPWPHNTPEWWLWRWSAVRGLCREPGAVHTGNSAYGALGLAYHLGFRDVLLVGVDGTQDARIEGGYPYNLSHLPLLFQSARNQVRLHTVGELDGIPSISLSDWLAVTSTH